MRIRFTKMQGAGNDFVVLDETRERLGLSTAQYRFLADRHFGVGADQILSVRASPAPGVDFEYVIHNADGAEVEQCGNGARCFARYVRDQGLTDKDIIRVQTMSGVIEPRLTADGRVTVNMGEPVFELARIPFDDAGLVPSASGAWQTWPLDLVAQAQTQTIAVAVVSMGNPHAVQLVDDVETAPVLMQGPLIEHHARFPRRVNAGFMQVVDRTHIRLRVYERGAGETLACGTGACAAVVAGIRLGLLDARVDVRTYGGDLTIEWAGGIDAAGPSQGGDGPLGGQRTTRGEERGGSDAAGPSQGGDGPLGGQRTTRGEERGGPIAPVMMTGPATTVFHGEIDLPELS